MFVCLFSQASKNGFVGLKNLGATCYMNSIMQTLFMQPMIRRGILDANVKQSKHESAAALAEVQRIFFNLSHSEMEYYDPVDFCTVFKDFDGQPMSLHEHQDAYEFFNRPVPGSLAAGAL